MIDLHISLDEKSTLGTMGLVRANFPIENNPFIIIGNRYGYDYSAFENVYQVEESLSGTMKMLKLISNADRVHLHGLFYMPLMVVLAVSKRIGNKCNWFIWGHDMYDLMNKHSSIPRKGLAFLRRMAVKHIRHVSTNVPGDYYLLEKTMSKTYEFHKLRFGSGAVDCILKHEQDADVLEARSDGIRRILLGNSATQTNCHIEALEDLRKYKDESIQIYIPLSYGNAEYGQQVAKKGKEIFGDKVIPMFDFMERDAYFTLLAKMDIAVFAHNRQQAIGNIVPLLYAGKKVYIKDDITTWSCLTEEYGLKLFAYQNIKTESYAQFCENPVDAEKQRELYNRMADETLNIEAFRKVLISEQK